MSVVQSFLIALDMLRLHKLRALLTMLGVIIGVMSVTIIVMVSSGFTAYMSNEFMKLGSDVFYIGVDFGREEAGQTRGKITGLRMEDVQYLRERVPELDVIVPMTQAPVSEIRMNGKTLSKARAYASGEGWSEMNHTRIVRGRDVSSEDIAERANVCTIGTEVAETLFPNEDPVGKYLVLPGITLEVVGVFERQDMLGQTNARDVVLPISTLQDKWIGGQDLMMLMARPKPGLPVEQAMESTWRALMLKSGNKEIYRVDSNESIVKAFSAVFGVAGAVLAAIAALSLLVGGIGIMNIMLVSVTERTKEIGLRKAVGAKRASVLTQFLVEAATLSLVGGLIGMSIAWLLGLLVTSVTSSLKWPTEGGLPTPFPLSAAIGSAIFSAMIGMVFGFYPAFSASRLDPIVALRKE